MRADGFASHMTDADYCGRELAQGVSIMGKATEYEERPSRKLRVVNSNLEIANMSTIDCSIPTFVYMEPKLYHMILEVRGGSFEGGSCDGKRTMSNGARLLSFSLDSLVETPDGGTSREGAVLGAGEPVDYHFHVRVSGGWAKSYKEGVKLMGPIYFNCSNYITKNDSPVSTDSQGNDGGGADEL